MTTQDTLADTAEEELAREKAAEATDPPPIEEPKPEPEPEPEPKEEPEKEPEKPEEEPEPEVDGEYTQEEWDALPDEERAKILKSFEEEEPAEGDDLEKLRKQQEKIDSNQSKVDTEKIDFEKYRATEEQRLKKREEDLERETHAKTQKLSLIAEEQGVLDEFKSLKEGDKELTKKYKGFLTNRLTETLKKKPLLTQTEVDDIKKRNPQNPAGAVAAANQNKAMSLYSTLSVIEDAFIPVLETVDYVRGQKIEQENRALWQESFSEYSKDAGFDLKKADPQRVYVARSMIDQLITENKLVEHGRTMSPEIRKRIISSLLTGLQTLGKTQESPEGRKDGKTLQFKKPPGDTPKQKRKRTPRKRPPPNVLGDRGGTSNRPTQKDDTDLRILLGGFK